MADKEPRQPTHRAYSVIRREGQDDYWSARMTPLSCDRPGGLAPQSKHFFSGVCLANFQFFASPNFTVAAIMISRRMPAWRNGTLRRNVSRPARRPCRAWHAIADRAHACNAAPAGKGRRLRSAGPRRSRLLASAASAARVCRFLLEREVVSGLTIRSRASDPPLDKANERRARCR